MAAHGLVCGVQRRVTVLHHPSSAAVIRRNLADDLAAELPGYAHRFGPDFPDDVAAVATELVGNAVRHARPLAGGVIMVEWRAYPDSIEIRVTDGGSAHIPVMRRVAPDSLEGRGLTIVASLSARWGVSPGDVGRCVWAWLGQAPSRPVS
jgi:hypothetical protein